MNYFNPDCCKKLRFTQFFAAIQILPALAVFCALIQSCAVQNHATTVERDKNNGCTVHVILQIGVEGTDSDVIAVRDQLEPCYSKKCVIPCPNDNSKGCEVLSHVVVKKWSDLSSDDKKNFHHITMVDNDGLPSNATIGTPNGGSGSGTWRRRAYPRTYCHEALHLAGLKDQYCSRIYDTITRSAKVEISCEPPPDPDGGDCCTPTPAHTRCSHPCAGHDNDLMATLTPDLSCANILDVVKNAGLNNCPQECCPGPHRTVYRPLNLIFLGLTYERFGDKEFHYGSYGFSGEYTRFITPKFGATLDAGIYFHSESQYGNKQDYQQFNITGGITYVPWEQSGPQIHGFRLSTHALFGISNYTTKSTYTGSTGTNSGKNTVHSFTANIGAALDWSIDKRFGLRLLQVDYAPTFFYKTTQNNIRISVGATLGL